MNDAMVIYLSLKSFCLIKVICLIKPCTFCKRSKNKTFCAFCIHTQLINYHKNISNKTKL